MTRLVWKMALGMLALFAASGNVCSAEGEKNALSCGAGRTCAAKSEGCARACGIPAHFSYAQTIEMLTRESLAVAEQLCQIGRYAEAEFVLEKVLRLNPSCNLAREALARLGHSTGMLVALEGKTCGADREQPVAGTERCDSDSGTCHQAEADVWCGESDSCQVRCKGRCMAADAASCSGPCEVTDCLIQAFLEVMGEMAGDTCEGQPADTPVETVKESCACGDKCPCKASGACATSCGPCSAPVVAVYAHPVPQVIMVSPSAVSSCPVLQGKVNALSADGQPALCVNTGSSAPAYYIIIVPVAQPVIAAQPQQSTAVQPTAARAIRFASCSPCSDFASCSPGSNCVMESRSMTRRSQATQSVLQQRMARQTAPHTAVKLPDGSVVFTRMMPIGGTDPFVRVISHVPVPVAPPLFVPVDSGSKMDFSPARSRTGR